MFGIIGFNQQTRISLFLPPQTPPAYLPTTSTGSTHPSATLQVLFGELTSTFATFWNFELFSELFFWLFWLHNGLYHFYILFTFDISQH
jgi:hypothetical protein